MKQSEDLYVGFARCVSGPVYIRTYSVCHGRRRERKTPVYRYIMEEEINVASTLKLTNTYASTRVLSHSSVFKHDFLRLHLSIDTTPRKAGVIFPTMRGSQCDNYY